MKPRKSSCTFFAAAALALAGCGDSDSTTKTDPIPDLLITIGEQERKASGAKGSADMSLRDATTKATMLSAVKVKGESSDAEANAQAILAAKGKVDSALMEANAALTALQKAKTEADALPADTPKLKELKAELAAAITEATGYRDAIQAIRDATGTGSLKKLMEKVTGTGDKKMTPADIAAAVAVEVEKILDIQLGFGTGNDRVFAEISGGVTPDASELWMSFANSSRLTSATPKLFADYGSVLIEDLPGAKQEETDYASYGYWLGIPKAGDSILAFYVWGFPKDSRNALAATVGTSTTLPNTAKYTGKALGMSVLTERDGRNHKAIKSGEFTADVKLTASFGDNPTVEGTVTNFQGKAIGSEWSVKLKDAPLRTGAPSGVDAANFGEARGSGSGKDTHWTARAGYVPATQRPNSISGLFNALFSDGRAIGGFATVKDE